MKHTVDDRVLGDVPIQDKQGVLNAKAEMDRMAEERNLAMARQASADSDLALAKETRDQAKLEVDKGQTQLDLEQKRKNVAAIRDAQERLRVATMAVDASDARIEWAQQRQRLAKAEVDLADAHQQLASARYELEKARLAQRENKQPSADFGLGQFESQVLDKQRRAQAAQEQVETQRAAASRLRERYTTLAQQYNAQRTQVPGQNLTLVLPLPEAQSTAQAPGAPSAM